VVPLSDKRAVMTYGIFDLASGNLVDSFNSEPAALELVSALLDEDGVDPEEVGLIVADDRGATVATLHGRALADAVYQGGTLGVHA
jgi:hypothetical protein